MFVRVIPKQLSPRRSAKRTVFVSTRLTLSQKLLGFRVGWVLQSKAASCPEFESARNGLLGPDRSPQVWTVMLIIRYTTGFISVRVVWGVLLDIVEH